MLNESFSNLGKFRRTYEFRLNPVDIDVIMTHADIPIFVACVSLTTLSSSRRRNLPQNIETKRRFICKKNEC